MTRLSWCAAVLVATLPASSAAQEARPSDPAADTLPGTPPRLFLLGFDDPESGGEADCPPGPPGDVPCVERVEWFLPPTTAQSVEDPGPLGADARHQATGQLLYWALSDIAYRRIEPPNASSAALDMNLWGWGAGRLPSAESTFNVVPGFVRPRDSSGRLTASSITTPAPSVWFSDIADGARVCRPLSLSGDASRAGRAEYLVCGDGFVGNFADRLNRPIEGDLFRHGRNEGARAARSEGELLISEYLFVSGRRGSPPWSNGLRYFDEGSGARLVERGPFRELPLATGGEDRFVVPRSLADAEAQPYPGEPGEQGSWWRDAPTARELRDLLDSGAVRFVQEMGTRIVSYGTLEYNPTHVRTSVALTAMLRAPADSIDRAGGEATVTKRNPGHRYAKIVGTPPKAPGDAATDGAANPDETVAGEIGVQVGKLPLELRWRWIGSLLAEAAVRPEDGSAQLPLTVASERCTACIPPVALDDEGARLRARHLQLWDAVLEAAALTAPDPAADVVLSEAGRAEAVAALEAALATFVAFLEDGPERAISQQLLESLLELLGINRSVLLFDDLLGEYEALLNSVEGWAAEELEEQSTAVWEEVLRRHGYQSRPQEVFGTPPNPLAVCTGRGHDDQAVRLIDLHTYFEGDASEAPTRVVGDAAWEVLHAHRTELPFLAIDAPNWSAPAVEPVLLLPSGRAVYRAEWRLWSGWHLFWTVQDIAVAAGSETVPAEGLVLRSGALCADTTLISRSLEPTLVRAALLRNFESTIPWQAPLKPPASRSDEELTPEEAAARAEEEAKAALEAQQKAEAAMEAAKSGEVPSLDGPAERVEVAAEGPAAELAELLRDRLAHDPRLSCAGSVFAGTPRDDLDVDGRSERDGDCDDTNPEPDRSRRPTLLVVADLAESPGAPPAGPSMEQPRRIEGAVPGVEAFTPYLRRVFPGGLVGSAWALSMRRTPKDDGPTVAAVVPDARALERRDRWGRRTTPELTLDLFAGWTPIALVREACDPEYEGAADFRCPKDGTALVPEAQAVRSDVTGNWLLFGFQVLLTTWEPLYARTAFEVGADVDFFLALPGTPAWSSSSVRSVRRFRQMTGFKFGVRTLVAPSFRTRLGGRPWSMARLGTAGGRFPRTEIGARFGFAAGDGWSGPEGGPNVEVWVGPAVRAGSGAGAASTPYRPKFRLAGFARVDLLVPLGAEHLRATRLRFALSATVGIRGALSLGEKPKEPDIPEAGDLELPAQPSLGR